MVRALLLISLFTRLMSFAQLSDDFEDGSFISNPIWVGDVAKFDIINGVLRSNSNTVSDGFYLSTKCTIATDAEWRINVNLKISTSSTNYADIYLVSDNENLNKVSNGYFVRVGNTKDEISLYKVENGLVSQLTDGTDNRTHNKNINLRVIRSAAGTWQVYADYDGGQNYTLEGESNDNAIVTSAYFGIFVKQSTTSFHLKHFFDNIFVGKDDTPPILTSYEVQDKNHILLLFDEAVDTAGLRLELDQGYGTPNLIVQNNSTLTLRFDKPLTSGSYNLSITGLQDTLGNIVDTTVKISVFFPEFPKFGDLLFTEIFPDPSPQIALPEAEFIELYNSSSNILNLKDCYLTDGGTPAVFSDFSLAPGEYLILTKTTSVPLFEPYGSTIGIPNFPTLNNSGDNLMLYNAEGDLVEELNYTSDFYQEEGKNDGGYTLERVFFNTKCDLIKNWRASIDENGGTPGSSSSVALKPIDTIVPSISGIAVYLDSLVIELTEELASENLDESNFTFSPNSIVVTGVADFDRSIVLSLNTKLKKNETYTLTLKKLSDCLGNSEEGKSIQFITTDTPTVGDLIFNEILFNPLEDGVDYIELYNASEKYIDLHKLSLARFTSERESIIPVLDTTHIFYPKTYLLLTTDTNSTKFQYEKARNLLEIERLPPMNNDKGTILLLGDDLNALDSLSYSEDQHFPLLSDVNGVSLERINFTGNSWDKNIWYSASSSVDFGTPGYQNSQFSHLPENLAKFSLANKIISPNGDGYQDLLALNYSVENGTVLNGYVFNLSGNLISQIINQETLATEGTVTWDGFLGDQTKIPVGNYVLLLESFTLNGRVDKQKIAFSVLAQF